MNKFINWLKGLFGFKVKPSTKEEQDRNELVVQEEQERLEREEQDRNELATQEDQERIGLAEQEEQERIELAEQEEQERLEREEQERIELAEQEEQERLAKEQEISDNFINNGGSLGPIININNYVFDGELDSKYPNTSGIYIVTDITDNQVLYVGQTSNLRRRFAEHIDSGKFKKYKILFEYLSMSGASYAELNAEESRLIRKLNPLLNVQSGGGNTNKTSIITYTDWSGKGMIKSFNNVSEMKGYIVGITGKIQGFSRKDIVSTLQKQGVDIKDKRKSISTDLWIVGKDGKVGATKNEMIEDRDYVMTHNNIVDIMKKIKK